MAFTSRSVNLSWAPPFNSDEVGVDKYLIEIRAGEETAWKDGTILPTPDNVTLYQVNSILLCYKSRDDAGTISHVVLVLVWIFFVVQKKLSIDVTVSK